MIVLSVNVNKIALLRNSRETEIPNVVDYARACVELGAQGITVHPRPDQRHIRADDCFALASALDVELNIEGNPFSEPQRSERTGVNDYPGFMSLIEKIRPAQCTLVPDTTHQLTSDHGFNLQQDAKRLEPILAQLRDWGVRSSVFVDPDPSTIGYAADLGADRIELYTEAFARAFGSDQQAAVFELYRASALAAHQAGLGVNAGHDLNLDNLPLFATIPQLAEVSIGHALTVDALYLGLDTAIAKYLAALRAH